MSDFDPTAPEAAERLDSDLDDPELIELRDFLERGAPVAEPEVVNQYEMAGEFAVAATQSVEVRAAVTVGEVLGARAVADTHFFISIRCRSHGQPFQLEFRLSGPHDFDNSPGTEDPRFVQIVGLFDGDHDTGGDVECVDAPLGTFTLDATAALLALGERDPQAVPTLQVRAELPDYADAGPPFAFSRTSIVEVIV